MQQFTQKYAIIQLFEPVPTGTQFSYTAWPLHTTIADVFAVDWDEATMTKKLTELLKHHSRATSVAQNDRFFGDEGHVRVTLLKKTASLTSLHQDIIELLKQGGWHPNNPEFAEEGFLPHTTVQARARLNEGDKVVFSALALIDMFPDNDPYGRKVLAVMPIGQALS